MKLKSVFFVLCAFCYVTPVNANKLELVAQILSFECSERVLNNPQVKAYQLVGLTLKDIKIKNETENYNQTVYGLPMMSRYRYADLKLVFSDEKNKEKYITIKKCNTYITQVD